MHFKTTTSILTAVIMVLFSASVSLSAGMPREAHDTQWSALRQPPEVVRHLKELSVELAERRAAGERQGMKILFAGPNSAAKVHAAQIMGNRLGMEVYRIDLSTVVSKYIGETEKNLDRLLSKAEHKDWILFFDEADALLGKRTNIRNDHDRYANREVSYLLQKIEAYQGIAIVASNQLQHLPATRFDTVVTLAPSPSFRSMTTLERKEIAPALPTVHPIKRR